MQLRRTVLIALLAAGCHTSSAGSPDASGPDAFVLSDAETSPGCDFVQRGANTQFDYETIPFDYTGQTFTVCGDIVGAGYSTMYTTHSPGRVDTLVRVDFDAPVAWYNGDLSKGGAFAAYDRGSEVHLDAQHDLVLTEVASDPASNGQSGLLIGSFAPFASAPAHYKATVGAFDMGTLCPAVTTPVEYTESHDGNDNTGNDVFVETTLTAATTDVPEPTGLTIDAGSAHRIAGTSSDVRRTGDDARDRDTFEITTGATTHLLYVRPTPSADSGAFLTLELTTPDFGSFARSGSPRDGQDLAGGIGMFAVAPSTTYWLQVDGAVNGNPTGTGLPLAYDLSICGAETPPSS